MPSFDIVSEFDQHELTNALDQANREVGTRFDFKDANATFTHKEDMIKMCAQSDFHLQQMYDVLKNKLTKRGIDLQYIELEDPEIQHKKAEQNVKLKQGLDSETAKKIIKLIKEEKFKVQAAIQGEKVRITGKKRDDLQEVIGFLRQQDVGIPLQYNNFRD